MSQFKSLANIWRQTAHEDKHITGEKHLGQSCVLSTAAHHVSEGELGGKPFRDHDGWTLPFGIEQAPGPLSILTLEAGKSYTRDEWNQETKER